MGICSRCKGTVLVTVEPYERVDMFHMNKLVQSRVYHPSCFVEMAREYADHTLASEADRLKDEKLRLNQALTLESKMHAGAKKRGDLLQDQVGRLEGDVKRLWGLNEDKDKELSKLRQDRFDVIKDNKRLKNRLSKVVTALDDDIDTLPLCWGTLWECVGQAIKHESLIREVVNKHNTTVLACKAMEIRNIEITRKYDKECIESHRQLQEYEDFYTAMKQVKLQIEKYL